MLIAIITFIFLLFTFYFSLHSFLKSNFMQAWKDYQEKNKDRFLNELFELLRIASVSAKTEHKGDMQKCAEAVKQKFLEAGVDNATIYKTDGHPVVFAEKIIDKSKPTV